jgi:hypothetical protein
MLTQSVVTALTQAFGPVPDLDRVAATAFVPIA